VSEGGKKREIESERKNLRDDEFIDSQLKYKHSHAHAYVYTYVYIYIHTYTHTRMHTYIRMYIHTCMHAYIYTYIGGNTVGAPTVIAIDDVTFSKPISIGDVVIFTSHVTYTGNNEILLQNLSTPAAGVINDEAVELMQRPWPASIASVFQVICFLVSFSSCNARGPCLLPPSFRYFLYFFSTHTHTLTHTH
jgi:hypothetical protein